MTNSSNEEKKSYVCGGIEDNTVGCGGLGCDVGVGLLALCVTFTACENRLSSVPRGMVQTQDWKLCI
jgi:hypothetical protein